MISLWALAFSAIALLFGTGQWVIANGYPTYKDQFYGKLTGVMLIVGSAFFLVAGLVLHYL